MIIKMLLDALYSVFSVLTTPIDIPDLPPEALNYVDQFFSYLTMGAGILANYSPFIYIMVLFGVIVAADVGILLYHFVMWVIRKIPFTGIT